MRLPPPEDSCDCKIDIAGAFGPPLESAAPPPRSGLAIREPPKLNPEPSEDVRPLVEPAFAASSLSLTAES